MRILAATLIALVACGGTEAPPPPAPEPAPVSGQMLLHHWDAQDHADSEPRDLHDLFFVTYEEDGQGGWLRHDGYGTPAGTFTVAGAHPKGPYWLRMYSGDNDAQYFIYTDQTDLDFSADAIGRMDRRTTQVRDTSLEVAVDGLSPWQDNDYLSMFDANAGFYFGLTSGMGGTWSPDPGATTFDEPVQWAQLPDAPLIAQSDRVLLVQWRLQTEATTGAQYLAPIGSGYLDPVNQTDGFQDVVHGQVAAADPQPYHLDWKRSTFRALQTSVHPTLAGEEVGGTFQLLALPGGDHRPNAFFIPPYNFNSALIIDPAFFQQTDADIAVDFPMAMPFPDGWLVNEFSSLFLVDYTSPDDPTMHVSLPASVAVVTTQLPSPDHPVTPLVSQAQAPAIGGKSLFEEQSGVGTTPVVSWKAPAIGQATSYGIYVYQWDSSVGLKEIADLFVPGDVTSVRLPPDLLQAGHAYVAIVSAISQAGQDLRHHGPFRHGYPWGCADLATSTFKP